MARTTYEHIDTTVESLAGMIAETTRPMDVLEDVLENLRGLVEEEFCGHGKGEGNRKTKMEIKISGFYATLSQVEGIEDGVRYALAIPFTKKTDHCVVEDPEIWRPRK